MPVPRIALIFAFALAVSSAASGNSPDPPPDHQELGRLEAEATAGDPGAQYRLAVLLTAGPAELRDLRKGTMWCRRSATQGNPEAQLQLGNLYERGLYELDRGPEQDDGKASRWYHQAAKQGLAEAQFRRARSFWTGRGAIPNPLFAFAWAALASEQLHVSGAELLATVRPTLSARELRQAETLLAELRQRIRAPSRQ